MGLLRCCCNIGDTSGRVKCILAVYLWTFVIINVEGSLPLTKPCGDIECQELEFCNPIHHTCEPCKDVCDPMSNNYQENRCVSDCQDHIHDERYLKLHNSTILELQRTELEEKYKGLEKDVLILKIAISVCVAVIAIVVACLLAFLVYFYKLTHPTQIGSPSEKKKPLSNKTSTTVELPTVYNNRYGVTTPTPENSPSVVSSSPQDTNISSVTGSTTVPPYGSVARSSPTKSNSSIATPGTVSTTLMSASASSTLVDQTGRVGGAGSTTSKTNRFRREPSESTLPDNCAYDNLSMSPQHIHYSHHV